MLLKTYIFFFLIEVPFLYSFMLKPSLRVPSKFSAIISMRINDKVNKPSWWKIAVASAGMLSCSFVPQSPAIAADTVKVGKCLLQSCQKELAQCILNPKCLANVICLNACNGRKDEAECEIKCGKYVIYSTS